MAKCKRNKKLIFWFLILLESELCSFKHNEWIFKGNFNTYDFFLRSWSLKHLSIRWNFLAIIIIIITTVIILTTYWVPSSVLGTELNTLLHYKTLYKFVYLIFPATLITESILIPILSYEEMVVHIYIYSNCLMSHRCKWNHQNQTHTPDWKHTFFEEC